MPFIIIIIIIIKETFARSFTWDLWCVFLGRLEGLFLYLFSKFFFLQILRSKYWSKFKRHNVSMEWFWNSLW